ncbi:MAG: bifunctional isocitrate dehydrogenase kinase/phosphatase [Gammaproteobacteria bacterium]|nr:MAG: bifunctional isocitrate dehydrogenase kinase/phosphatase [Gammaproteobacteria bacterium]
MPRVLARWPIRWEKRFMNEELLERARQIARSILTGFDRHYSIFQEITSSARKRFERADWESGRVASANRINFYDLRVLETIEKVRSAFGIQDLNEPLWQEVKRAYQALLARHSRPELAETFYNSVFCRLFDRKYFNNDNIFLISTVDREALAAGYLVYMSFHPRDGGLEHCVWEILSAFYFSLPYEDIQRDTQRIAAAFRARGPFGAQIPDEVRIDVLESPFYRNKAAYLIGRVVLGQECHPFIIPLVNNEAGEIFADTLLTTRKQMELVFSFTRAYFMVKTPVPAATVDFLHSLMPGKSLSDLYMSIGFLKQAKNEFYRDFLTHLADSEDCLQIAPGTRGLVMLVFTLASFPYVFKVIRDRFPPQKDVTRQQVKQRYLQVKHHDRMGRMADTLEFSDVAFPINRFAPELLAELEKEIPSLIEREGDMLVIRHLYIERRMTPLDLYLAKASPAEQRAILDDWGLAIKELMGVNIFPGDLLFKNFGVTRQGRVVFYDYDEICYLSECKFRKIPQARTLDDEMSAEPWYTVNPGDVFPEEFPTFLTTSQEIRRILFDTHPEIYDYRYWQQRQKKTASGVWEDIFPYDQQLRFPRPVVPA